MVKGLEASCLAHVDVTERAAYTVTMRQRRTQGPPAQQQRADGARPGSAGHGPTSPPCHLRFPYLGLRRVRPRLFDGTFRPRDLSRLQPLQLKQEGVTLHNGRLHHRAFQQWLQGGGVRSHTTAADRADPDPVPIFRSNEARFQIEFLFRDCKQYLGLALCQARSQARLQSLLMS